VSGSAHIFVLLSIVIVTLQLSERLLKDIQGSPKKQATTK